jgi:hypothetical protein
METCALSILDLCDSTIGRSRFATDSWCERAKLSEQDALKVKGKQVCEYHGCHPERINNPATPSPPAKKLKTDSPMSPLPPPMLQSPVARPQMKDAASQTAVEKTTCLGVNNANLERFIEFKFGFTYPDEDGYPWGQKQRGWTTFRAIICDRVAKSAGATRCNDCQKLFVACSNARSRHNQSEKKGTQKFTPISALKVSPYVKELLEKYKKENTESQTNVTPKIDEEIEVEVCFPALK